MTPIITIIISLLFYSIPSPTNTSLAPKGMVLVPNANHSKSFYIDKTPVTIKQFKQFINATHYKTEAEIAGNAGVYDFSKQEWTLKNGAHWKYPMGKDLPKAPNNHPATQISWNDAQAYCKWAKKRLPTQAEWIRAARNAQKGDHLYPWGNDLVVNNKYMANCWQGIFPSVNLIKDGFRFTSPVGHYGNSPLGLVDMAGNVWEWTKDETSIDNNIEKIQKGGSFMCEKSVCHGYAIESKSSATAQTALFHVGFRCVRDF